MKKWLALLLFPVSLSAQDNGFTIKGNIKGWPDGSKLVLSNPDISAEPLASAVVGNGSFEMKGMVSKNGTPYFISEEGSEARVLVFMENKPISVSGHKDSTGMVVVEGSDSHKDYDEFLSHFNPKFIALNALSQKMNTAPDKEAAEKELMETVDGIQKEVDSFVVEKRNSPVAPFIVLITGEMGADPMATKIRYDLLEENARQSYFGEILGKTIAAASVGEIGSEAPDFTQNDVAGKPVSLQSFRGKYVLIDFWASWCGPCRMENPTVVDAYNSFKDKNFTVLGVSLDKSKQAWEEAIAEDKLDWTQVSDLKYWQNEVAQLFRVQSIPQNFLIDPDGKIVAKNLRGPALKQTLEKLLN